MEKVVIFFCLKIHVDSKNEIIIVFCFYHVTLIDRRALISSVHFSFRSSFLCSSFTNPKIFTLYYLGMSIRNTSSEKRIVLLEALGHN